jgi:hypothetical protein
MLVQVFGPSHLDCHSLHFSRDVEAPSGTRQKIGSLGVAMWTRESLVSLIYFMLEVVGKGPSGFAYACHFQL